MNDLDAREVDQQDRDSAQAEMIELMIQQDAERRALRRQLMEDRYGSE